MDIPRQTHIAYDPDIASFKFSVRLCVRSKTLMKRLVQAKKRYDADFGLSNLWKYSERPNKFIIQTLAFSSSEKTQVDQKELMIHTLPRSFLCALLGTFSGSCGLGQ